MAEKIKFSRAEAEKAVKKELDKFDPNEAVKDIGFGSYEHGIANLMAIAHAVNNMPEHLHPKQNSSPISHLTSITAALAVFSAQATLMDLQFEMEEDGFEGYEEKDFGNG